MCQLCCGEFIECVLRVVRFVLCVLYVFVVHMYRTVCHGVPCVQCVEFLFLKAASEFYSIICCLILCGGFHLMLFKPYQVNA